MSLRLSRKCKNFLKQQAIKINLAKSKRSDLGSDEPALELAEAPTEGPIMGDEAAEGPSTNVESAEEPSTSVLFDSVTDLPAPIEERRWRMRKLAGG